MRRILRTCCALAALSLPAAAPAQLVPQGNVVPDAQLRTVLPQSLPVLRDAAPAAGTDGWRPAWLLLALSGGAGGWWVWRRLARRAIHPRSRVRDVGQAVVRLSSQPLTPQASVHAVQWRGEEFLVACTTQQVTLLSRSPVPPTRETP